MQYTLHKSKHLEVSKEVFASVLLAMLALFIWPVSASLAGAAVGGAICAALFECRKHTTYK